MQDVTWGTDCIYRYLSMHIINFFLIRINNTMAVSRLWDLQWFSTFHVAHNILSRHVAKSNQRLFNKIRRWMWIKFDNRHSGVHSVGLIV